MNLNNYSNRHDVYSNILLSRGMQGIDGNMPLWKLKLADEEYNNLKFELRSHAGELGDYGMDAALYYAEWWRREYSGNIPSKEDVANALGINSLYTKDLFVEAYSALRKRGYIFIHSQKGTEYFRTLLNQGGIPINYIKSHDSGFSNFSRFLKGLVSELSIINYDWNTEDNSIIHQFNCISYLSKSFKNDNIYDVSMQIAHAIIMDDTDLLPYDDTDSSLSELTKSLKREYSRAKSERRVRPLSLHWKLRTTDDGIGYLFVNMDIVKDISSDSIPELKCSSCYAFDVFVAGVLVGKYVRKSVERDYEGKISATYTRISVGVNKDILWKGEAVVEVKVRCDNDDRIFLTIAGCYPPNFDYPQVFQMLDDNIYCKSETANVENNIAIFAPQWKSANSTPIRIGEHEFLYEKYTETLDIENTITGETISLTNKFSQYSVEFAGNYISWIEKSNYKLLTKVPIVRVYDKEKNRVYNCKTKYRVRNNSINTWRNLNSSCVFPIGLVDICVELPDGHSEIETFYAIDDLSFCSQNEQLYSTEIYCKCRSELRIEIEEIENMEISKLSYAHWKISRSKDSRVVPSVCSFRIYNAGYPTLCLSVAIPFDGIMITDVYGNVVPDNKIISFSNLSNYTIISHGGKNRSVYVTYTSDKIEDPNKIKHLESNVIDGIVSLSDYSDLITRMFNLYGANSFDRSSSVVFNVSGKKVNIRKFVLESTIEDGKIIIQDKTQSNKGDLYAFPVGEEVSPEDFNTIKLTRLNDKENEFSFPEEFEFKEVVVFSGAEVRRRIIPKYYNREGYDFDKTERDAHSCDITRYWSKTLINEEVMSGKHWQIVCKAFDICSKYNLPFTTFNGLKSVVLDPKLVAKFIIAMWINEYKDVLSQDIDRFEQEMVVALHWVPVKVWNECIEDFLINIPDAFRTMMENKMVDFIILLKELFSATVSTDIAEQFSAYIATGILDSGQLFFNSDMNNYKSQIHGLSDMNNDLPSIWFQLKGIYYQDQPMLCSYKAMIESAMCAAENTCSVDDCTNLFSSECREHARIANFYRKYFKETYSDIFFRTVKIIENNNNKKK